jgi:hypothetical protein
MAQEFFLKTVNNVPADESGNVELTIGVSLLRQEFNFTNSQSFTLNSNYSQVYAIVVQGVTLSNSQYTLNGTNGFTILDTLTDDDFIVVIYALNIGGVTPSYTKAEVDVLLNVGDVPLRKAIAGATGLNQGGLLTINTDAAKFDLSAGFGYIVNGHSDPDNPTYTKVTWTAKIANTIPNLATQKQTYVAVDINKDLYFTNVPLTATQRRNFIRIGVLIHLNNSSVTYIDNQPTINIEIGGQVQDILEALGFRSLSGNRIFPVSNNLKIKKELGRVFKPGANFNNLTTQPHSFTLAAQEPITFRYRTQTGAEGLDITDINPAIYDLNGTITPVAATATLATIQRVYIFQDGEICVQPGQRVFTSLNAAITALNSDVFVTDLDIAENGLYLGAIVLTRNAVDLSNISQAIFAPSIATTANGSVASPALAYTAEDVANKQNSLALDGTGTKYPTVDAVNAELESKITGTGTIGKIPFFDSSGSITSSVLTYNSATGDMTAFGINAIGIITNSLQIGNALGLGFIQNGTIGIISGQNGLGFSTNYQNIPNGTEHARFDNNGNFGIFTTTPTEKLDVNGSIKLSNLLKLGQFTTATEPAYVKGAQFFNTTLNKMRIGGATAYETVTSNK